MITTLNTMLPSALPRARARPSIIAALSLALLFALAGCSSLLKFGYSQAGPLAYRWLDGYVDFDQAQAARVRAALDDAMAWHRRSQLPDYVELLVRAEGEAMGDTTPERMCAWGRELHARIDPVLQYLAPAIAEVALTLSPAQIAHIEKRYAESNGEWRDEHWQRDPGKRQRAAVKAEIERAEFLYGRLDQAQRELVARAVAASPYDAELAFGERQNRQQDALALARRLREGGIGQDDAVTQVRVYMQHLDHSPREGYRAYAERLAAHNCRFASELHNTTSAAQRRAAVQQLKDYESDLRALIAEPAS
jgi:Family of unknown function (DUF6279)